MPELEIILKKILLNEDEDIDALVLGDFINSRLTASRTFIDDLIQQNLHTINDEINSNNEFTLVTSNTAILHQAYICGVRNQPAPQSALFHESITAAHKVGLEDRKIGLADSSI